MPQADGGKTEKKATLTRELVLHLGDHKTGSTAIQKALADRAWRWQPGSDRQVSVLYTAVGNHNVLAQSLLGAENLPERHKRLANFAGRMASSEADIAVLSAEEFERVDPQVLHQALQTHFPEHLPTARLIAYVRPHAERLVSSYAERIKQGYFQGSLTEFHVRAKTTRLLQYAPRFRKWRAVFGDQFELRPMIRSRLYHTCVVQDFLHYLLRDAGFELTAKVESNPSLSVENLAMLRALQAQLGQGKTPPHAAQNAVGWHFAEFLTTTCSAGGTRLRPHRTLVADLQTDYHQDAAALDTEFFQGQPMTEALEQAMDGAVEAPQSIELDACFSVAELHRITAWIALLHRMYLRDHKGWPQHMSHFGRPSN